MIRRLTVLLVTLLVSVASASPFAGIWLGTMNVGPTKLRLGLTLEANPDGTLKGILTSVDQGGVRIPLTKVTATADTLTVEARAIGLTVEGKLNGDKIESIVTQSAMKFPVVFHKVPSLPTVNRPQTPKPPFPYRSEEVRYENSVGKNRLGGTLTLPEGAGPFPAVLLITGSGAQDRNQEILSHRTFLVIADFLTRRGIAVLRVDDRGVGASTGNFAASTSFDFATDVEAGVAFLKSRADIRANQIGLIGHSEGGLIAPIVAARNRDVAFVVLMAGPGVSGRAVIELQSQLIGKAAGASKQDLDDSRVMMRAMMDIVTKGEDLAKAQPRLEALEKKLLRGKPEPTGDPDRFKKSIAPLQTPWMRAFLAYDPQPNLRKVKVPVLILNGERDLQVDAKQNVPAIQRALRRAGNRSVKTVLFPDTNHLFQTSKTGSPSEYGEIEETIRPDVLETIASWLESLVR